MNTNKLKKFAQETRRKLLKQVNGKLEHVLTAETGEFREKADVINELKKDLERMGREALVDRVAYTWFNRFIALRYMDVRGFQPLEISILTPKEGQISSEILQEAMAGYIPDDLKMDRQKVMDLLDGRIASSNADNEAFRLLLVGVCNHLHHILPFLFERIDDYSELLLPDDLTSEFSIVQDVIEGMDTEDCQQVEILGWLYQFYISEKKDELINAKKKYKPNEIAPVTQLFTPKWLVKFMVDNSLGQYWKEVNSNTKLTTYLEFYIPPQNPELIPQRDRISPEKITFFDPCVGSGHILTYAFDLFFKMYEEEGYPPSEIPELILTKNLYGIDIDERASQIAGFALMMKGREKSRRFFKKEITPNVTHFVNFDSHPKFVNSKVLGSLIEVTQQDIDELPDESDTLFGEHNRKLKQQAEFLANSYDVVVTNPPYLNSSYMEKDLKKFVRDNYSDTKSDLFACFLLRVTKLTKDDGMIGFICPYVWMFIKSYEQLREFVIKETSISSLVQLEYNAFGPAVVPICSFSLRNKRIDEIRGSYIKLSNFKGAQNQAPKTLEAIQNPDCSWFYTANQNDYEKIPGKPIGFWLSKRFVDSFVEYPLLDDFASPRQGMTTTDNNRFLRYWQEISINKISFNGAVSYKNWFPHNKGGKVRRWYGNFNYIVNYEDNGTVLLDYVEKKYPNISDPEFIIKNRSYYFNESITWTDLTTTLLTARYVPQGFIFDASGPSAFVFEKYDLLYILSFLNTKVAENYSKLLNPTFHFTLGDFRNIPLIYKPNKITLNISDSSIEISKFEWNSRETSWDFQQNELIRFNKEGGIETLEKSYDHYKQFWQSKFYHLHKNEEELNRQFIEIYGLQEELTPNVPLDEITILQEDLDAKKVKKLEKEFRRQDPEGRKPNLPFKEKEVIAQFLSYAVGCMFGRYSLDKEGLILANKGETLEDYLHKISLSKSEVTFLPDDDNIIPILDDEWFEDDIVACFQEFLKASFGEKSFQTNLSWLEDQLGKDLRKYFTRDFYSDHVKRYSKRPIYWKFTSSKGYFSVLIYMHRYTPDTLNKILNKYLREFMAKLETQKEQMKHLEVTGSANEKARASKEIDKLNTMIKDCEEYEREILYPLASERIEMDLDDGVLVNYNLFGKAVEEISGVNDKAKKKKVKEFNWIDGSRVR